MSGKIEIHQSMLGMHQKCMLQYRFRYVDGIKTPPNAALTIGRSVDVAVSANLTQKITSQTDLPEADVLDACSTEFDRLAPDTTWDDGDAGAGKDAAIECAQIHHKEIAPLIQPETVQENFKIDLADKPYAIGGTIDLVEKTGVVADTKTSNKAYGPDSIFRALQPAMYDFAYEALRKKKSTGFRYDVTIKPYVTPKTKEKKPAKTQRIEGTVSDADRAWLFRSMDAFHKAVEAGMEVPAPDGAWWCSEKWCGYWSMCKGKQ